MLLRAVSLYVLFQFLRTPGECSLLPGRPYKRRSRSDPDLLSHENARRRFGSCTTCQCACAWRLPCISSSSWDSRRLYSDKWPLHLDPHTKHLPPWVPWGSCRILSQWKQWITCNGMNILVMCSPSVSCCGRHCTCMLCLTLHMHGFTISSRSSKIPGFL